MLKATAKRVAFSPQTLPEPTEAVQGTFAQAPVATQNSKSRSQPWEVKASVCWENTCSMGIGSASFPPPPPPLPHQWNVTLSWVPLWAASVILSGAIHSFLGFSGETTKWERQLRSTSRNCLWWGHMPPRNWTNTILLTYYGWTDGNNIWIQPTGVDLKRWPTSERFDIPFPISWAMAMGWLLFLFFPSQQHFVGLMCDLKNECGVDKVTDFPTVPNCKSHYVHSRKRTKEDVGTSG